MTERVGAKARIEIRPRQLADPGSLADTALRSGGGLLPALADSLNAKPASCAAMLSGRARGPARGAALPASAFGTSGPAVRSRLEAALGGDGYFVSTGHQPVFLLGPLFVVYKILTAISLAGHLEQEAGIPVVPLFWIASDDHDWVEVGGTTLLDRTGQLQKVALPVPEGAERQAVGSARVDSAMAEAVDRAAGLLDRSEFTASYDKLIRDSYANGRALSEAFARLLHGVLGDRGYAWLDSANPEVKRAAAPLHRRIIAESAEASAAVVAGAARIAEAGFRPPIPDAGEAIPLFYDSGAGRHRVRRAGNSSTADRGSDQPLAGQDRDQPLAGQDRDELVAGPDGQPRPVEAWLEALESSPERFSPNVASRPIVESYLLPVAATVLGPGEISYWSQLEPLFDFSACSMPLAHPRAAWTLVEQRIRRVLDREGIAPDDLANGTEKVLARLTREGRPEGVAEALRSLRQNMESELDNVESAMAESLPGLEGAVGRARRGVTRATDDLSRQVGRAVRQQMDTRITRLERASTSLFPLRRPQERVLSPFAYLCRYGPELIDWLARETERWIASSLAGNETRSAGV